MKAALDNALTLASWLQKRGLDHHHRLQPRKLHLLLFLAQYRYGMDQGGAVLMPATFIACQDGPREPNLYAIIGEMRELPAVLPPPFQLNDFLDKFWIRYDALSTDHLMDEIKSIEAFRLAHEKGEGHIIDFKQEFVTKKTNNSAAEKMTLKDGRRVEKWRPLRHLTPSA